MPVDLQFLRTVWRILRERWAHWRIRRAMTRHAKTQRLLCRLSNGSPPETCIISTSPHDGVTRAFYRGVYLTPEDLADLIAIRRLKADYTSTLTDEPHE